MISLIVVGMLWLHIKPPEFQQQQSEHPHTKTLYLEPRRQSEDERIPDKTLSCLEHTASSQRAVTAIDDVGNSLSSVKDSIEINAPLTFAILYHCPYSVLYAQYLHKAKREILLHIPTEPLSYHHAKPEKGILHAGSSKCKLINKPDKDIRTVPYATGVNNHMVYRSIANEEDSAAIVCKIKKGHEFFVDSWITYDTKRVRVAKMSGLRNPSRQIFIDSDQDYEATLQSLLNPAPSEERTPVVIINYPYRFTIQAPNEAFPRLNCGRVDIVCVSHILS